MVADEGGLPVVLYNVPGRTGVNMAAATSLQLAQHPNIVAIKEASGSLDQFHALLEGAPESFSVLSGDDAWTLPLMLLGGHGVVSVAGNVAPAAMTAMVQAAQEGRLAQARDLHFRMLPLFDALFATTNPIPVKQAAAILGHAEAGVRAPLQGASFDSALAVRLREALQRVLGAPVS